MNIKYILPENLSEVRNESRMQLPIYCLECKTEIKHEFLIGLEAQKPIPYDILYSEYELLKCINCDSITFRVDQFTADDVVERADEYGELIMDRLSRPQYYPTRDKELANTTHVINLLPESIQETFNEVVIALNNNLEILSGLGLRTLLEQICKQFIQDDDLGGILRKFEEEGYISTKQRYLLDDIRYIGNDAAHRAQSNSLRKHKLSLSILVNLIQLLFAYYKYDAPKKKIETSVALRPSPKGVTPKVRETTNKRKPKKIL
ncbi:DUF4145 domain-containing protein [Acinetobacter bereziniae]|uniref:DUF4145 domain-containing protein n=1 Tax=Acinetobacter bereziniae TaxID=106648 RepID=UPI002813A6AF|nr:DUF4145 domain-containing protein [Acinetobacter bereziniae]MDQ9818412.1 DUF4145 domain-containing protein [Acinetobacter bereziniae]